MWGGGKSYKEVWKVVKGSRDLLRIRRGRVEIEKFSSGVRESFFVKVVFELEFEGDKRKSYVDIWSRVFILYFLGVLFLFCFF